MAELLVETSFTEEKHAATCSGKKLKQTEELADLKVLTKLRMTDTLLTDMLKETT